MFLIVGLVWMNVRCVHIIIIDEKMANYITVLVTILEIIVFLFRILVDCFTVIWLFITNKNRIQNLERPEIVILSYFIFKIIISAINFRKRHFVIKMCYVKEVNLICSKILINNLIAGYTYVHKNLHVKSLKMRLFRYFKMRYLIFTYLCFAFHLGLLKWNVCFFIEAVYSGQLKPGWNIKLVDLIYNNGLMKRARVI